LRQERPHPDGVPDERGIQEDFFEILAPLRGATIF
jgi:hypothetical protein